MIDAELDIRLVEAAAARILHPDISLERTKTGLSTYVYRIIDGSEVLYLRVLPEDASFAAEALTHRVLAERGVRVPQAICYEHKNELLGKSIMLTSEIPGNCIATPEPPATGTLFDAGAQLALINSVKVEGFSWIDRSRHDTLFGKKHSFKDYYCDQLETNVDSLVQHGFDTGRIKQLMEKAYILLETGDSFLAHGDFDDSHIFCNGVAYTGIIDFSEIRGSHRLYDLGHYKLHDRFGRFAELLDGYDSVHPVPHEDIVKIDCLALFVGLSRARYPHYRRLIQKQLDEISRQYNI